MMANGHRRHLVITGPMGIGKSTTAKAVAAATGMAWHDSDRDIETLFGRTGGELATEQGLDELHRLESAVLLGRLAADSPSVIAAAAWVVEDPRCREALGRRARVVVLHAPQQEILRRMATGGHRRTMSEAELAAITERRRPLFASVADLALDATRPTDVLVAEILASLDH
jgi:shikimate kinase